MIFKPSKSNYCECRYFRAIHIFPRRFIYAKISTFTVYLTGGLELILANRCGFYVFQNERNCSCIKCNYPGLPSKCITWKIKLVMEKSWKMKKWPSSFNKCFPLVRNNIKVHPSLSKAITNRSVRFSKP